MELIKQIVDFWGRFTTKPDFIVSVLISIIIFTVLYYYIIKFLVANNSAQMVTVFALLMIIVGGIFLFNGGMSNSLFLLVPVLFIVLLVVLYSTEIKRIIWTKKSIKLNDAKHDRGYYDEDKIHKCINEIIKALQDMSKNDVGAIIVLSSGNIPSQVLESGVSLESDISSELIESVFFPKTPLHDGAMIINGTKIVAAGCFLPLSQNIDKIPKELGSRHRAGIGVTETIDVISLIVSEETGIISIAKEGKMTRYADATMLRKILNRYFWQELDEFRN